MDDTVIPRSFQEVLLPHLPYAEADGLAAADDLAALGLDSMGVVQLLAELEDAYGVELPDEALTEETFATVGSLWSAVEEYASDATGGADATGSTIGGAGGAADAALSTADAADAEPAPADALVAAAAAEPVGRE